MWRRDRLIGDQLIGVMVKETPGASGLIMMKRDYEGLLPGGPRTEGQSESSREGKLN